MMVNSYYGIYQAERGKTTAEIRAADAQLGGLAAELGQLDSALAAPARAVRRSAQTAAGRTGRRMRAGPSPLTTVPRPREDGQDTTGLSLVLPCTEDPELFFAESPQDVEQAKAMCRGCRARLACLAGALERREPWGVWGGELLMSGAIVPHKRPRGRPRKDVVLIGANA